MQKLSPLPLGVAFGDSRRRLLRRLHDLHGNSDQ